jgi:hypothetical protein
VVAVRFDLYSEHIGFEFRGCYGLFWPFSWLTSSIKANAEIVLSNIPRSPPSRECLVVRSTTRSQTHNYIVPLSMCDYRRGLDCSIDLLTTYTNDSELQTTTAPLLISTTHKSPQHPLSLFQPAVSLPSVPWQRLPTVEILQLHAPRSSLHNLPCRTLLN